MANATAGREMDLTKESSLVEALYDAALGHLPWELIGYRLRDYMGGKTLMLSTHDPRHASADVVLTLGLTANQIQAYGHFAPHDMWALGALRRRAFGRAFTGGQLVDDAVLLKSYIYNEYLKPDVDARYMVGSLLSLQGGNHAIVGVHRPHDARDFTAEDSERLNRLLPHLRRALEVRQKVNVSEHEAGGVHAALDRVSVGVVLLAADGRLLHVNAAADAILRAGDGLLRARDTLRARHKEDDKRLQQLIAGLRQPVPKQRSAGGHLRIRRTSGLRAYAVMLAPAPPGAAGGGNSCALMAFISDPAVPLAAEEATLGELFGFSPAEARLVLALIAGKQLPDIAREIGVSYNTVRTQLARAMNRTETRTQVELALLVTRALGGVR